LPKVSKNAIAGRDPSRLRRLGPLRFSADGARSPNSLRSDMGCSSAPPPCDARLALRLDRAKGQARAKSQIKDSSNSNGNIGYCSSMGTEVNTDTATTSRRITPH